MAQRVMVKAFRQGAAMVGALLLVMMSVVLAGAEDAVPAASDGLPRVIDMRILNNAERARLIVDLDGVTAFATASLADPDRIVVDMKAGGLAAPVKEQDAGTGLIASYALAVADTGRVRATLTLSGPAEVQQAYLVQPVDKQPARLIVDLTPSTPERFAHKVADDLKAAMARIDQAAAATATDATGESNDNATATVEPQTLPTVAVPSKARPLIVIDPGHGGVDSGAEAPDGTKEKDIALKFSRELRRLLVAENRYDVAMTRDGDSFIKLEDRVQTARSNKADLFISIHADTFADPDVRGASIYVRDGQATDALDKVLADNENRADVVAGFAPPDADKRVTSILLDLMRRETQRQSFQVATDMLQALGANTRLRRFPLRKADFFVLQAPEVPSVLVELGFISNNADVANLTETGWRDKTAEALAKGINAYFDGITQN